VVVKEIMASRIGNLDKRHIFVINLMLMIVGVMCFLCFLFFCWR